MKLDGFKKTNTYVCVGIGLAGGALDTIGAEQDAKNIAKAVADGKKQPIWKQWGTLVNYALPVIEVGLVGFEVVRDEMAGALAAQAGQLAGAKVTRNVTMYPFGKKKNYSMVYSSTPSQYSREPSRQDRYQNLSNPAPTHSAPAPPVVSPPSSVSGRGSLL